MILKNVISDTEFFILQQEKKHTREFHGKGDKSAVEGARNAHI
jgi:hypothetical protein